MNYFVINLVSGDRVSDMAADEIKYQQHGDMKRILIFNKGKQVGAFHSENVLNVELASRSVESKVSCPVRDGVTGELISYGRI